MINDRILSPRLSPLLSLLFASALLPASAIAQKPSVGDSLLGRYAHTPVENDWHKMTIEAGTGGRLLWKNAAGRSWPLEIRYGSEVWSTKDCPYGVQPLEIRRDEAGEITGLRFNNETYRLVAGREKIDEFWKVALASWRAGPVRELDEEEVDGTAQTFDSAALVKLMIEEKREIGELGYSITHRLISAPSNLDAVHEISWAASDPEGTFQLTEVIYDFTSSPAKKHVRAQKFDKHFYQLKSKPESVVGSYKTEALNVEKAATLKQARPDWWSGGLQ